MALKIHIEAEVLLKSLIKTPSFSKQEDGTAQIIADFLKSKGIHFDRWDNNIIAKNKNFSKSKPTVVLNSHHDTVKVVDGWTKDPHGALVANGILYGLGSNDAGASLVGLISAFVNFYEKELDFNLVLIASAEEEVFGPNGIKSVLPKLDFDIALGIVGEPTEMQMAVSEKGLLVIDGIAKGEAGHAARPNGKNAIDIATADIAAINAFEYPLSSEILGPVVKSVTQIKAGYQHNVIPDTCEFVIDMRVNDAYSLQEAFDLLQKQCKSELKARSYNNRPSKIALSNPIVQSGIALGLTHFGSATLSDQVHFNCPTLKIGIGKSERSHQADEHIYLSELSEGVDTYIKLIAGLKL